MFGFPNIITTANTQTVPPFPASAADNGLSVDPITGHIVLGNDQFGILATLLSNREIPLSGFMVAFTDTNASNEIFGGGMVAVDTLNSTSAGILTIGQLGLDGNSSLSGNATPVITMTDLFGGVPWSIRNTSGELMFNPPGTTSSRFLSLDRNTNVYQIGDIDFTANRTRFVIDDNAMSITSVLNGLYDIMDTLGNNYFFINQGGGSTSWGDINGVITTTFFTANFGVGYTATFSPIGFGINQVPVAAPFCIANVAAFANNAAALAGGLVVGDVYRISVAGTSTLAIVE